MSTGSVSSQAPDIRRQGLRGVTMYMFELLDEERKYAEELKKLQEAKQEVERMTEIGYPAETIKRYCRKVSGFDNLDTAIAEAYRKVDTVQKKIRGFMLT